MIRFAILLSLLATACTNHDAHPKLKLADGWARETVPGQTSAAAYLTILNDGTGADRLVGLQTDAAAHAMLHSTVTRDGVTRMRHLKGGLEIPSKAAVELSPTRTHVMLSGLKAPLYRGETIDLQLKFERSGRKNALIKVVEPSSAGPQQVR
ncbi:MAG TPA: copper chaperone PCu(A)C [Sphingomicrobium sp.]|jgi:copper(I)-binding protein|nr:copper chaperone PCu(A)C [Sphingomicrobium sp.]